MATMKSDRYSSLWASCDQLDMVALKGKPHIDEPRCVSQVLTGRRRERVVRYAEPLPALAAKVDAHLARMGLAWN